MHSQLCVIFALVLREVHTLYGQTSIGYLWVLIQNAFAIFVFLVFKLLFHATTPHGITILAYLVSGFGIWNIASHTINKCLFAVDGNRSLITFPHVFTLDIIIARSIVICGTQILTMTILLGIGFFFNFEIEVFSPSLLILSIVLTSCLGLGLGAFFAALSSYFPVITYIIPMFLRVLFFTSGVFFSVSIFSKRIGDILLWNPIMQLIELTRSSMSRSYQSPYVDIPYLVFVTLSVLTLGLLLERYTRKRQQS